MLEVKALVPTSERRNPKDLQLELQNPSRTHYWAQASSLGAISTKGKDLRFRALAPLLRGWRRKFLPSAYGLWIEFESSPRVQGFFIQVRGNILEAYYRPSPPRGRSSEQVVRWLSERHGVPVQSLQISRSDWTACVKAPKPWRALARALRAERARWSNPLGIFRFTLSVPF